MEFDRESLLTNSDEEEEQWGPEAALFAAETDHMVCDANAIDFTIRREAATILVQARFGCNLDPLVIYLAINYIDRFLSKRHIPRDKPWIIRLLAISCLSLAAKMKRVKNFSIADLQEREEGFIFDAGTTRRMELLVLGALEWRMRSITPFSFFGYFISFFSPAQPPLLQALKSHASQNVFKAQNDNIKMLEFKPSVVAATALLSAAYELFPVQFAAFRSAVASCQFINKEQLMECLCAMDGSDSSPGGASRSRDTPVTVLPGHHRHSASTESESTTVRSGPDDRDPKKRRISAFFACDCGYNNNT